MAEPKPDLRLPFLLFGQQKWIQRTDKESASFYCYQVSRGRTFQEEETAPEKKEALG